MHLRRLAVIVVLTSFTLVAAPVHAAVRHEPRDVKTRIVKILKKLGLLPTTLEDSIVPPKP
jgi:hypothetical protein